MKEKTARRFIARNAWRAAKYTTEVRNQIRDNIPPSFERRWLESKKALFQETQQLIIKEGRLL